MYFIYIIQSLHNNMYYVGSTADINARLLKHNSGDVPSTRKFRPWKLVWYESVVSRSDAVKREKQIKARKSRKYIESLINRFQK
jgi:putative endonuclease